MSVDSGEPEHTDADALARQIAAALSGGADEDVLATVREILLARLAEDELTPDERAGAARLLAQISGGTTQIQ